MHFLSLITAALALIGAGVYGATTLAALVLARKRMPVGSFMPPVTVLKPVKGVEPDTEACFRSHFEIAYPQFELLFGVADPNDPAVAVIERLRDEFPNVAAKLVICPQLLGPNRKVSSLVQMLPQARFDHFVLNDADMRVRPEYLRDVISPFVDSQMGCVTCLYRARAGKTLWSKLEAIGIGAEFMPGVMLARWLDGKVRFGLGATLAFTRAALDKIGGFEPLLPYLADDYELGVRIGDAGYKVELAAHVVETQVHDYSFAEFWAHQVRWGRTVRDARPGGYAGLIFTFAFFWAIATLAISLGTWWAWTVLAAALGMRMVSAVIAGGMVLGDVAVFRDFWALPIRDLLAPFIWLHSLVGNTIVWRGECFKVKRGKIEPEG